ncbi:MAG: biliverdin reductase [Pseudomonadota bacterium]
MRLAFVGVGVAGAARVAAARARGDVDLMGGWRGRHLETSGLVRLDRFDDALSADIVAISSPDDAHAAQVAAALAAGCHVLVDYPLAQSAAEGAGLFRAARAAGRVLHVEHIDVLAGMTQALKAAVADPGPRQGGVVFETMSDAPFSRSLVGAQSARVTRWVAALGPVRHVRPWDGPTGFGVTLTHDGATSTIDVRPRSPRRAQRWWWGDPSREVVVPGAGSHPVARPLQAAGGLFGRDLAHALDARILAASDGGPYWPEAAELHVLDVLDAWARREPCELR